VRRIGAFDPKSESERAVRLRVVVLVGIKASVVVVAAVEFAEERG
jgi:hypothetical protein